jgi:hypothetical protein
MVVPVPAVLMPVIPFDGISFGGDPGRGLQVDELVDVRTRPSGTISFVPQ